MTEAPAEEYDLGMFTNSIVGQESSDAEYLIHEYCAKLDVQIEALRASPSANPFIANNNNQFDWFKGYLGNPFAKIWFVGEIPSLSQIQVRSQQSPVPTPEDQWNISEADKRFRRALDSAGFIDGDKHSLHWNCYITDFVKASAIDSSWNQLANGDRNAIISQWWPVIAWEIETAKPRILVALGDRVDRYLENHLETQGIESVREGIQRHCPVVIRLPHYSARKGWKLHRYEEVYRLRFLAIQKMIFGN